MKEEELYQHLKRTSIWSLEKMEYAFSHWDCTAFYETQLGRVDYILELKCRDAHYGEMMIEQVKYDWLIEEAGKRSARPAYINWTPQGIFSWDLYRVKEPIWTPQMLPATTEFENTEWIQKVVGYLPIADAIQLP